MKLENVTQRRDPETFAAMCEATKARLDFHSRNLDAEANPTQRNLRALRCAERVAGAAEQRLATLAAVRGYEQ